MNINELIIRPEKEEDYIKINEIVKESFNKGTEYSDGTGEVALINEIRTGKYYINDLSFVAEIKGEIVGYFMISHFPLGMTFEAGNYDREIVKTDILILAPVAVNIKFLRRGIGKEMIMKGIDKAKAAGYKAMIVEGNPEFYHNMGFLTSSDYGIFPSENCKCPHPECMMIQELYQGALKGIHGFVDYSMYKNA